VEILADHRVVESYPRGTKARLLIDQADYEGDSTDQVARPTPLGEPGAQIVLQRSREAPKQPIERYAAVERPDPEYREVSKDIAALKATTPDMAG